MMATQAGQPTPAVAATVSVGGAVFAWLAKAEPVLEAIAAIFAILSGLAAVIWYGIGIYYKIKTKGATP